MFVTLGKYAKMGHRLKDYSRFCYHATVKSSPYFFLLKPLQIKGHAFKFNSYTNSVGTTTGFEYAIQ